VKILVTGFVPWGKHRVNPSGELASAVGGHLLPVHFDDATRELRRLIRKHRPETVLMLGLAAGRKRINLELVALNVEFDRGRWRRIRKGGSLALMSRLPLDRLLTGLRRARVPATLSFHAGTYVCNRVFYEALSATPVPCGFVHVPPFKAMSRPRQLRAIRTILRALGGSSPAARRSAPQRAPSRPASSTRTSGATARGRRPR
jgi:pyroglutamyl-peptidase